MTITQQKNKLFSVSNIKIAIWFWVAALAFSSPFLFQEKETFSLWLNAQHHPILDQLFFYLTYLGDGLFFIPVFLLLLYRNYVLSALFAVFVGLEAIIVQVILKKGFFAHLNRPPAYIENFDQLYQVPGVDLHNLHTFPSGHTQSAFLVAFFLVLLFKNYKYLQVIIPLIAVLVGISRIYLLQHFFVDIWFGALIGFSLPLLTFFILQKTNRFPKDRGGLLDKIKKK